jgi:hypothetical protein
MENNKPGVDDRITTPTRVFSLSSLCLATQHSEASEAIGHGCRHLLGTGLWLSRPHVGGRYCRSLHGAAEQGCGSEEMTPRT